MSLLFGILTSGYIIASYQFDTYLRKVEEFLPSSVDLGYIALNIFLLISIVTGWYALRSMNKEGLKDRLLAVIGITLSICLIVSIILLGMVVSH